MQAFYTRQWSENHVTWHSWQISGNETYFAQNTADFLCQYHSIHSSSIHHWRHRLSTMDTFVKQNTLLFLSLCLSFLTVSQNSLRKHLLILVVILHYTSVQRKLLYQSNWPMFMSASQLGQCTAPLCSCVGMLGGWGVLCCFLPNTSTVIKRGGKIRLTNSLREGNTRSCILACDSFT